MRRVLLIMLTAVLIAACGYDAGEPTAAPETTSPTVTNETTTTETAAETTTTEEDRAWIYVNGGEITELVELFLA